MLRLSKKIGLLWQLLVPSLIGVALCVIAVQAWTLRVSQKALEDRMDRNLDSGLHLLQAYLTPLGTRWSRDGGQLRLGDTIVAGREDLVDLAARAIGGVATIFSGDERVATNVRKPDGSRAVGTRLADPTVREAVLQRRVTYRGQAEILGQNYLTIYDPVLDSSGQVVGILFIGLPSAELADAEATVLRQAALASVVLLLLYASVNWLLISRSLRPLDKLAGAMRRIADGDLDVTVPSIDRQDQVGRMAAALAFFKQSAMDKRELEADAAALRESADSERGRIETGRVAAAEEQSRVVADLGDALALLAEGDLTRQLSAFPTAYKKLEEDFNAATEKLRETVSIIAGNGEVIRSGTGEISHAADDLSRRTEQQAAALEQTAAALDEINATVRRTAEGATQASRAVNAAKADADHSGDVVQSAIRAMAEIAKSSGEISQIIGVIDEIAFQTNLLALNAGVEAARAGEAGRGFAVVASEVRALAQRSAQAAKEIKALIQASTGQVVEGVELVGETGRALTRIAAQVADINGVVRDIAASAQEQATGLAEVSNAVHQMDQVTQQNAAMVQQTTAASHSLASEAEKLGALIAAFRTGGPKPASVTGTTKIAHARTALSQPAIRLVASRTGKLAKGS